MDELMMDLLLNIYEFNAYQNIFINTFLKRRSRIHIFHVSSPHREIEILCDMDHHQESNSLKQLFSLPSSPFFSTLQIKKHIFVGISLLISFLILSVIVVDLAGFEPHLCFGILSSSKTLKKERGNDDVCDYSYGRWVRRSRDADETFYGEECRFLDPGFRCLNNRRIDSGFRQWRWQPHGCNLPR